MLDFLQRPAGGLHRAHRVFGAVRRDLLLVIRIVVVSCGLRIGRAFRIRGPGRVCGRILVIVHLPIASRFSVNRSLRARRPLRGRAGAIGLWLDVRLRTGGRVRIDPAPPRDLWLNPARRGRSNGMRGGHAVLVDRAAILMRAVLDITEGVADPGPDFPQQRILERRSPPRAQIGGGQEVGDRHGADPEWRIDLLKVLGGGQQLIANQADAEGHLWRDGRAGGGGGLHAPDGASRHPAQQRGAHWGAEHCQKL